MASDDFKRLEQIGIAVVGLGFGALHAAAFRRDPRCRVVSMCGRDPVRAREVTERLRVPRYSSDWRELLDDEDVQVISLAVPAAVQQEIGCAALAAGKHVLFEKPLACDVSNAEQLALLAHAHARLAAINFELPEAPPWREAKRLLDAHRLGALRHASVTWRVETYANRSRTPAWKSCVAAGGGALSTFTSHCFHYVEWLLGPMQSLTATLGRAPDDGRDGDTLNTIVMQSYAGLPVVLTISTDAFHGGGHRVEICGERGTLVLENRAADYVAGFRLQLAERGREAPHEPIADARADRLEEDGRVGATAAITRRLVDAITSGGPAPAPSLADGVRVQLLIDSARRSSERQAWMTIPEAVAGKVS